MSNPLAKYFRQPRAYIDLPSKGIYNKQGEITSTTNMPVYGMTGMDEILLKTPDALMTGESTIKVIESCCPNIIDASELSTFDLGTVLSAIRIATYGNNLSVNHVCVKCGTENNFSLDLSLLIDHYKTIKFDNKVLIGELTVNIKPLSYRESTEFSLRNYQVQRQLAQIAAIQSEDEKAKILKDLKLQLSALQMDIILAGVDSVVTDSQLVSDREYIAEWLSNCDKIFTDKLRDKFDENKIKNAAPPFIAECDNEECKHHNEVRFELDESNFFGKA